MTPNEIYAAIARCETPIEFATTPARAFILVAQLQLALRHPDNTGESAAIARQMVEHFTEAIAQTVGIKEVRAFIELGNRVEWDMTDDEFAEYLETEGDRDFPA